jgi:hypothetical protein
VKVFISYSRLDASETANTIHTYLKECGHKVFIDTSDIRGGDEWRNTIEKNISDSDIFVLIVSRSAYRRPEVKKELELADNMKKRIIPCINKRYVNYDDLPDNIKKYNGINFQRLDDLIQELDYKIELEKDEGKTLKVETESSTLEPSNKYSNVLKQFFENISEIFNKNNVSVYNKKMLEESIKQLVKDVESIQSLETIKNSEKEKIQIKIKNLIQNILKFLPLEIKISESFSILSPLNDFLDKSSNITINDLVEDAIQRSAKMMTTLEQEKKKNLFSINLEKIVESSNKEQDKKRESKIILASSGVTEVAREKNNCIHTDNDSPHTHGAFSFYLIEGLEGKAADSETGIISIDSLRKYIENQMTREGKQKPIYSIAEASNFDNIKIAVCHKTFNAKIKKIIHQAEELIAKQDLKNNLDLFSLYAVAKKVNELIQIDPHNEQIPILQAKIDNALGMYKDPALIWLGRNIKVALLKINDISDHLYEELFDLVDRLSFTELLTISESYLTSLNDIFTEVRHNTKFETSEDKRLNLLTAKLRRTFDNEKRETQENSLKQVFSYKKDRERRKAIVIGVNEHEYNKEIPTLNGAENDAKEIHDRLIQYGNFEISNEHFLIGSNATRRNILKAVHEVFQTDNKYDLVTFYFSGHGIMDRNDEGYLAPYDMDPDFPSVSGISMKELKNAIYDTRNIANTIIILDCSYAGTLTTYGVK